MDKIRRQEIKFITYITTKLDKEVWTKEDLQDIYKRFKTFTRNLNLDEIGLLRKGEVFLGNYIYNITNIKDTIYKILEAATNDLNISVSITMIAALIKLSLEKLNDEKEE